MIEYGPTKTAKQVNKPPDAGLFSPEKDELSWQKCREQFAKTFGRDTVGFFFSHEPDKREGITHFIRKCEVVLAEVSEKFEPSQFSQTNLNFALWVEPSEFWKVCEMRRSFFTILLRCGLAYQVKDDNFEEALFSQSYTKRTKDATQRFFYGFTRYSGKGERLSGIGKGWVNSFEKSKVDDIRGRLLLPKGVEQEHCLVGAGSLWT